NGRAIRIGGDPDHPMTRGWLCAKVRPYLDRVYHPDRLLHPLRRIGPKGEGRFERVTWEEAIAEIAGRWTKIIDAHGGAAILPYSFSGTLGLVQMGISNQRLWNRMGASGLERSICGAAAEAAVSFTLGARWAPPADHLRDSKLIVVWGHNPASTNPHVMPFLQEAQRAGAYLVVIDPRRTITARRADLHLRPNPASDGALALGLMHVLFAENLHDEAWLRAHGHGWEALRDRAAEFDPARVAAISGIPAETIVALARRLGTTKPAIIKFADGMQRHANGGQTIRALCCLAAVTGQIGVRGGGVYYSTSDYAPWDAAAAGHAAECPPTPRVINMNRLGAALLGEAADPPVMGLYVFGANPAASAPNSGRTIAGLLREDLFTVVHEQFMTDTARYADIVLPATTQLEQTDLHRPYGQRHLQYNAPAIAPLGEAKSNWDVMRLLATGMGYDEPWLRADAETVIREVLDASRATNPLLTGVTLERLQEEGTVAYAFSDPDWVPFSDGVFPTPSGKVELRCDQMTALGLDPLPDSIEPAEFVANPTGDAPDAPLTLLCSAAHHFVSTSMANQEALEAKEGVPFLEIHPADAATRGIADGQEVLVENARGWCVLRAVVTDDVRPGVIVSPKGRWHSRSPHGRTVSWTAPDALGDLAGQSTFHSNRVTVRPIAPLPGASAPADELVGVAD
ncbi:MAG: molybdopterin oxidoreductase family protein, partial [Thermomicrobiales bacterium]|nr:molybdopterin oxidoreductase family protein [Thermomicrobiales bacterium]